MWTETVDNCATAMPLRALPLGASVDIGIVFGNRVALGWG